MASKDEHSAAVLRQLRQIPALIERAQHARLGTQARGSREAEDRMSPIGIYPGMLASIKLAMSADHLRTLHLATRADGDAPIIPTWAHYSLLRGAIETAVDALWLTDRNVSSTIRLGRALERMLDDFEERSKAEHEIAGLRDKPGYVSADTRIAELLDAAELAGICTEGYPGTTQLVRDYALCGEGLDAYHFRFLSGILHGVAWASVAGDHTETREVDDEMARVRMETDLLKTWYVTRCAVRVFLAATAALEGYVARA